MKCVLNRHHTCNGNGPCRLLQYLTHFLSGVVNASKSKPLEINNSFNTKWNISHTDHIIWLECPFQKTIQFPKPACNAISLIPIYIWQDALKASRDSRTVVVISCQGTTISPSFWMRQVVAGPWVSPLRVFAHPTSSSPWDEACQCTTCTWQCAHPGLMPNDASWTHGPHGWDSDNLFHTSSMENHPCSDCKNYSTSLHSLLSKSTWDDSGGCSARAFLTRLSLETELTKNFGVPTWQRRQRIS